MTNYTKGQSKELLYAKELEKDGWTVEFRSTRNKYQRVDLGYRPTKEERDTCECSFKKHQHPTDIEDIIWKIEGVKMQEYRPEIKETDNPLHLPNIMTLCHGFKMKKLTGWKAAKFDIEAIKDGVILRVSIKNWDAPRNFEQEQNDIKDYRKHHQIGIFVLTSLVIWHKPQWRGRGKDKHFEPAHWDKKMIF